MDAVRLTEKIKGLCYASGTDIVGIASPVSWETDPLVSERVPPPSRPASILVPARSVIVVGIPVPPAVLETAPSIAYSETYKVVNTMLDQMTQKMTMELMRLGYEAMPVPRDGYQGIEGLRRSPSAFFSHRHAAYLAGLGTFGDNNMLLNPRYGPRVRYSTVITSADLVYDSPLEGDLCTHCGRCVRSCPADALTGDPYPVSITKKDRCVSRSESLRRRGISPCGMCISSCPIGRTFDGRYQTDDALESIRSYEK